MAKIEKAQPNLMNFKERKTVTPTVKVRANSHPIVHITELALNKMFIFTKEITTEVGWLGTVKREGNQYLIEDVFLLKQEVHATTTEITPEGLTTFAEEILAMEDGFELWNNIKMWGHSHVNMGITPSGQDNSQMEIFSQSGHDFFIRLICNKLGELAVDVYDFDKGIEFHNVKWQQLEEPINQREIDLNTMMEEIKKKYQELKAEKDGIKEGKVVALGENLKEEIKDKVKKFTPVVTYPKYGKAYASGSSVGDVIDGVKVRVADLFTGAELYRLGTGAWTPFELKGVLDDEYPEVQFTYNDAYKIFSHTRTLGYKPSLKKRGY